MRHFPMGIVLLSLVSCIAWGQEPNDFHPAETNVWGRNIPGSTALEECRFV